MPADQLADLFNPDFFGQLDPDDIEGIEDAGDGWGAGVPEREETELDLEKWGTDTELETGLGELGGFSEDVEDGYVGAITFGQPVLTYPDVWYLVLAPNFARVRVDVSVDAPPLNSNLAITVNNGTEDRVVVIPRDGTKATLVMRANGTSLTSNTSRTMAITGAVGGGYEELDISATAGYTVAAYPTTLTFLQPGVWVYSVDATKWKYEGVTITDFEWDVDLQEWNWTGSNADWTWDPAVERWLYVGSASGWTWLDITQRWWRTTTADAADPKPEGPPASPPPLPASIPTVPLSYTITARMLTSQVPVDRVSTLALSIRDESFGSGELEFDRFEGQIFIPGVSMYFGQWRWNPATTQWEYPYPPSDWQWTGDAWEFLGQSPNGWEWSMADKWQWTGDGEPLLPVPRSQPPLQNNSIYPPDAERWIWNGRQWIGEAHVADGVAPLFDSLQMGRLTYHRQR